MNSLSNPIPLVVVNKTLPAEHMNETIFKKIIASPQHQLYMSFVKEVYSKMPFYDRVEFVDDPCLNSLERIAETLKIPKPCNNPLPDVCSCCRK